MPPKIPYVPAGSGGVANHPARLGIRRGSENRRECVEAEIGQQPPEFRRRPGEPDAVAEVLPPRGRQPRLARSVPHMWEIVQRLQAEGVGLRIVNLGIDTATPTGKLMLFGSGTSLGSGSFGD